jgi:enoyl-CoA hydratase/carnithine racemase
MSENVVISSAGGVMEVRLNRPEKKNALTREMYNAMAEAFDAANGDASVRVVLLTGTGDAFTSGNDVGDFRARANGGLESSAGRFLPAISGLQKPLVGAVNGMAVGVGTTMLMHCDLIVAADTARFLMPFTALGLVPEAASTLLVPRAIGHVRASALLLLGDGIDAQTALAWGLINQVVAGAVLMETARAMAARLAALPPEAVRQTKALMKHDTQDVPGRMEAELVIFKQRLVSPEAKEAFAAFAEKRKPDFSQFY